MTWSGLEPALTAAGIGYARIVIEACLAENVPVECVCVLLVKETGGGQAIWGHDQTPPDAVLPYVKGGPVTPENYAAYKAGIAAGLWGRQGVGPMQLTHYSLQDEADAEGGCWNPETNIRVGVRQFGRLLATSDSLRTAFRRYNAGGPATANPDPEGPGEAYATDATTRLPYWQQIVQEATMPVLVVQMGHVGRPPCPNSQGTAGEQTFTRRAADACVRLLHGRGGWTVKVIDADPNYSAVPKMGGNPAYYRGDAFVAIHCDGSANPDRDGGSLGYRSGGTGFARDLKAAYVRRTGRPATWMEPDNYTTNLAQYYGTGIATSVGNPRAVILECGFLTNPADRAMLLDESGPDNVALAIGDALGIPTDAPPPQEDDVSWTDKLPSPTGYTASAADWLVMANVKAEEARDAARDNQAMLTTLLAAQADDLDEAAIKELLTSEVRAGFDRLTADLPALVGPALGQAIDEHGVDLDPGVRDAIAASVVRELGARLGTSAGSPTEATLQT